MPLLRTAETRWAAAIRRHAGAPHQDPAELADRTGLPVAIWPAFCHADPEFRRQLADGHRPKDHPAPSAACYRVVVFVNDGRWLARCPFCGSCQEASDCDRRFFCAGCLNAAADGCHLPACWPDEVTRARVEALLAVRPVRATRNWQPGETVARLEAENRSHAEGLLPAPVLA